ncbi:hypothetical protein ACQVPC_21365 [Bacillus mycoides]|uniref:Uncharacterized protein n=1 Tax=Bacillus cereus VD021 TaxID=1053224 RepID=R8HFY3_BACCE|nr:MULTISPECIES: hypothetical protein [Bacillus cereus group]EOO71768.1 hypothetical protein IIC_04284 [Bacillus cereus VD021]MCQ6568887.1 hypothetical protein [Bacillus mycoides]
MNIQYDEYELLEIFEDEPEDYFIPGAGAYRYSKKDKLGFELVMIMCYYEEAVSLNMFYENKCIFETKMESAKRIYTRNDSVYVQGGVENKTIEVKFKPQFMVQIEKF